MLHSLPVFLRSSQTSSHSAEDGLKATAFLTNALFDKETAHSYKPEHAPLSHAYDRPIFDFFAAPGNEAYLKRFGMAMYAINSIMQGEATLATGVLFQHLRSRSRLYERAALLTDSTFRISFSRSRSRGESR